MPQPAVAVTGFAQAPNCSEQGTTNGVELLVPLFTELLQQHGLTKEDIGFWCSGSSDYLAGRAFSFVTAVDAIGAYPPINESHVEMDAAWALYEAWIKILTGEVDTAMVYGFGKSSATDLPRTLALQLDPYSVAPLWPDSISIAGLQARSGLESGLWSENDMAEVVARSRADAVHNGSAQLAGHFSAAELLAEPYYADPLRRHDCPPSSDGAAAVLLASADRAPELRTRPPWINGLTHSTDSGVLTARDLTRSSSTETAARGLDLDGVDLAELHAPFSHQEIVLRRALGLDGAVRINPSGGPLCGNPMFSAGLSRIGEAADHVMSGSADKACAHATSGPALQQNLLCVLEGAS